MPLFNPPLYKRANRQCPNCGHPGKWWDSPLMKVPWSEWNCPKCGFVLGIDLGRRALQAIAVGLPITLVLMLGDVHRWPGWAEISFFAGWGAWVLFALWWFDSVVVRRPAEGSAAAS